MNVTLRNRNHSGSDSGGDANSNYGNVTRPYSMQPSPSHPIHDVQNGAADDNWRSHGEGRVGWGQDRFNVTPNRPVSMPVDTSMAGRMSAESSSESEAHSVSSVSGKSGSKDKDKKSGMFRFLKSKKNGK